MKIFLEAILEKIITGQIKDIFKYDNQKISREDLSKIISALNQNKQIHTLSLVGNNLNDQNADTLASLKYIKKLVLSHNDINLGILSLVQNKNFNCLFLDRNNITDLTLVELAKYDLSHLQELNLDNNSCDEKKSRLLTNQQLQTNLQRLVQHGGSEGLSSGKNRM